MRDPEYLVNTTSDAGKPFNVAVSKAMNVGLLIEATLRDDQESPAGVTRTQKSLVAVHQKKGAAQ